MISRDNADCKRYEKQLMLVALVIRHGSQKQTHGTADHSSQGIPPAILLLSACKHLILGLPYSGCSTSKTMT